MTREEVYHLKPGDLLQVTNYAASLHPRYAVVVSGTGPDVILAWRLGPSSSQWVTIDFDRITSTLQHTRLRRIA